MKKESVIYITLGFFLIAVIYVTGTLSAGRTNFFGRASGEGIFNPANSYVFASPLTAKTNGEKVRISVFALDGQGKGLSKKRVIITCKDQIVCQNAKAVVSDVQPTTDSLGQALFDFSAPVPGKFEIQASVDGGMIPQTVMVSFQL